MFWATAICKDQKAKKGRNKNSVKTNHKVKGKETSSQSFKSSFLLIFCLSLVMFLYDMFRIIMKMFEKF